MRSKSSPIRKIKPQREQEIQKAILDYLRHIHAVPVKINNGGVFSQSRQTYIPSRQKGISDILACYKGYFIAIEVKRKGAKPTPEQLGFLDEVRRAGGFAIWTDNLDDVIEMIDGI